MFSRSNLCVRSILITALLVLAVPSVWCTDYIYFMKGDSDIYRCRTDGSGMEEIVNHATYVYARPRVSSSRGILFMGRWETTNDAWPYFTSVTGGAETQLSTRRNCNVFVPVVHPTSSYAFYTWNTGYCPNDEINRINLDGTGDTAVVSTGNHDRIWDVSGDGKILYTSTVPGGEYSSSIYEANEDGSSPVLLLDSGGSSGLQMARYSPNRTKIIYMKHTSSTSGDIWRCDRNGSNHVNLTNDGTVEYCGCAYSPDGTKIVFSKKVSGIYQLSTMNADGSGQIQITSSADNCNYPDWVSLADPVIPALPCEHAGDTNTELLYHFDETSGVKTYDASSNAYIGSLYEGAGCGASLTPGGAVWAAGKFGNALQFDGINDFVDSQYKLNVATSGQFTVEYWIYPMANVGSILDAYVGICSTNKTGTGFRIIASGSDFVCNATFRTQEGGAGSFNGTVPLSVNQWYYIAWVWNNKDMKLYVNGVESPLDTNTFPSDGTFVNASNLLIGAGDDYMNAACCAGHQYTNHYNGKIDEVRISETSRSGAEILNHYNCSVPTPGAYIYFMKNTDIYRCRTDGSGSEEILNHATYTYGKPRVSVSRQLLFVGRWESVNNAWPYFTSVTGGAETQLSTRNSWNTFTPVVHPTSAYAFYTWNTGDPNDEINRINLDGTGDTAVISSVNHDRLWDVCGDGKILYTSTVPAAEYTASLYETNEDGSSPVLLLNTGGSGALYDARYSPDRTKIIYMKHTSSTSGDIWRCDRNGSNHINLTNDGTTEYDGSSYSPDGTQIAFSKKVAGVFQLWTMNADGSGQIQITSSADSCMFPDWVSLASASTVSPITLPTPIPTIIPPKNGHIAVHKSVINLSGKGKGQGHATEAGIVYQLDKAGNVTVEIYDKTGRLVKSLTSGYQNAGTFEEVWNATNAGGSIVPAGVYKVVVHTDSWTEKKTIVVIR